MKKRAEMTIVKCLSHSRREKAEHPPRRSILHSLVLGVAALTLVACSRDAELEPFSSDGCSLFPDSSLISESDWCRCCFDHDIAYWQGGTSAEREAADQVLRDCVAASTGNTVLARAMYDGVRIGGSPYFYNWYRWGYGWAYGRNYQPLTTLERSRANTLLDEYYSANGPQVCD